MRRRVIMWLSPWNCTSIHSEDLSVGGSTFDVVKRKSQKPGPRKASKLYHSELRNMQMSFRSALSHCLDVGCSNA